MQGSILAAALILAFAIAATALGALLWRKRHETRVVERALLDEVDALRWQAAAMAAEITRRHRAGEGFDPAFFSLWRLSAPLVYPAIGAALGRLPGDGVDRVGYFHAQLADARARLAEARAAGGFEPTPYRMLSALVRAYNQVEPWLRAFRPRPAFLIPEPGMGDANELLEAFEDAAEEPRAIPYCWVDCTG